MRREGACEVGGKWDATCEASRQPSVFMLTRRAAVFAAMRPKTAYSGVHEPVETCKDNTFGSKETYKCTGANRVGP